MSSALATSRIWHPWSERIFGKLQVSPIWVGAMVSLFTLAVLITVSIASGELQAFAESSRGLLADRDARLAVSLCVLVGLFPAAQLYMVRFTQANLRSLEPLLARGAEVLELPRPGFWQCILPGILLMPAIAYAVDRDASMYFRADYLSGPIHLFQWAVGFFCTINVALSTHLTLACAGALAKRAEAIPRIDLLDLSALGPFARQSLQSLLVWLLTLSIFSVNATDAAFFLPILAMSIVCLGNSGIALLRCNRTIHLRIQRAKRDEMARVNAALRGDRSALSGLSLGVRSEAGGLSAADLLAYRRFVDESREWALDTSAWLRTALYLAIPLGSWLGGALVERALEASLQ